MNMLYRGIGIIFLFIVNTVLAQHQNDNWIVGAGAGMSFTTGTLQITPVETFPIEMGFRKSASYSDPVTGKLIVYTDGATVYNNQHQIIENGDSIDDGWIYGPCLIVPYPGKLNQFYIFNFQVKIDGATSTEGILSYAIVDMSMNGGLGKVIQKHERLGNQFTSGFTAVMQPYDQGWWLLTHKIRSDSFYCYRIEENGINPDPVISAAGQRHSSKLINQAVMVSSSDGKQIFFSDGLTYSYEPSHNCLFYFDKKCGQVSFQKEFFHVVDLDTSKAEDIAFSKSGRMLYISWQAVYGFANTMQSILMQYDLSPGSPYGMNGIDREVQGHRDMQLAPDGKIYMTDYSDAFGPGAKLSVIDQPDLPSVDCGFLYQRYNLNPDLLYAVYVNFLPTFITNWQQDMGYTFPKIVKKDPCLFNNTLLYAEKGLLADSILWDLGDGTTSREQAVAHDYPDTGTYPISLRWYSCNRVYEIKDSIIISPKVNLRLDPDTTICKGTSYTIRLNDSLDEYRWSTGDSIGSITVSNAGAYVLQARRGLCWVKDSIEIKNYPDIWTSLGDEYYICNDSRELVRLDAGEGFQSYRWNPTGDTTQWITVADLGDYFVVVKDFHGCGGNDGTKVKRRCPARVYFPNVFTPNGDGLNDEYKPTGNEILTFHMKIYNRWGMLVFETNDLNRTWNGKIKDVPAPADVYFYTSTYSGYFNKRISEQDEKGSFSLIR